MKHLPAALLFLIASTCLFAEKGTTIAIPPPSPFLFGVELGPISGTAFLGKDGASSIAMENTASAKIGFKKAGLALNSLICFSIDPFYSVQYASSTIADMGGIRRFGLNAEFTVFGGMGLMTSVRATLLSVDTSWFGDLSQTETRSIMNNPSFYFVLGVHGLTIDESGVGRIYGGTLIGYTPTAAGPTISMGIVSGFMMN